MLDPPRPAAVAAVAACHAAGIDVKMITGDHAATAAAIAERVGIAGAGEAPSPGPSWPPLHAASYRARRRARVFARVSPEQKLRLVEALQPAGTSSP